MTTVRQVVANRKNAHRSTGPVSEAGRRSVSENARRHGLSAPLPDRMIWAAFAAMLDDLEITEKDLSTEERAAIISLVRADLDRRRAQEAELAILLRSGASGDAPDVSNVDRPSAPSTENGVMALLNAFRAEGVDERLLRGLLPSAAKEAEELLAVLRYRARAETARRKALRAWRVARRSQSGPKSNVSHSEIEQPSGRGG